LRLLPKSRLKTKALDHGTQVARASAGKNGRRTRSRGLAPTAGVDVAAIRRLGGLSQAELARVSGYSTRSIAGWEAAAPLTGAARRTMVELRRLFAALAELMPAGEVGNWLRNPNPSFDGMSPMHIIERGESDRLWEMIHQIDANVAN